MILSCHATEGHQDVWMMALLLTFLLHQRNIIEQSIFIFIKYFEALDFVENEINRRFDQSSLAVPDAVETFLIKCANTSCEENFEVPDTIAKMYSKDLNMTKLKQQAQMLPDLVATYKTS